MQIEFYAEKVRLFGGATIYAISMRRLDGEPIEVDDHERTLTLIDVGCEENAQRLVRLLNAAIKADDCCR